MSELIVLEKVNTEDLFTEKGKDWILEEIKGKIKDFVPDISTPKGRKEIASLARRIATSKTTIDKLRLDTVSEWKEKAKKIDQGGKLIRDALDALKAEVRKPLTDFEEAEKNRISDHESRISEIVAMRNETIKNIQQGETFLKDLSGLISHDFQEFKSRAERECLETKTYINDNIIRLQEIERQKAELAELKAKKEEQERIDRERRIAEEAELKARLEDENKARLEREALIAEQQAVSQAKIETERKAREKAERELQVERKRIEAEKLAEQKKIEAQKAEISRREADKEHRQKINNYIADMFVSHGITREQASSIIKEIVLNKINNISINY